MRLPLAVAALAAVLVACDRPPADPPPRHFMHGGVWFPAAAGYWVHQYATNDDIERLMADLGFACVESPSPPAGGLRCERGFRLPWLLRRTDHAEFEFRPDGAVALARLGCRFEFFEANALSGTCAPYTPRGAVYPNAEAFAAMALAMLRPARIGEAISTYRMPATANGPLADAEEAVDRLRRWRFACDPPLHRYTATFRGNVGEIRELTCQQWSLPATGVTPQSQQVIVRYDTANLAVLGVTARLDDATAVLPPMLHTPRAAASAASAASAATLALETVTGERFEIPLSSVGTGSRKQTREAFATLTPDSQRALVRAYLERREREWGGRLEKLSQAYLGSLEWYGPDALEHVDALVADERPDLGAAVLKYRCFEADLHGASWLDVDGAPRIMAACIDERRAAMPRSIATLDRLLARELRTLAGMDAKALNAFLDFRRDAAYVYALGPDNGASAAALADVVAGKEGIAPDLAAIVAAAIAQRDRPAR
ncbi:MAG: hypothetical protein IPM22_00245 [Betaproteobacteria bacterium]|nr:hypothetical protein [Betaproteobacteria bacterium]